MKKVIFVAFIALSFQLSAQHQTLFQDLKIVGAFGGPFVEISSINGQTGADVGGGGALILNNFFIGGYGQGADFADFEIPDGEDAGQYNLRLGHGGFWLGYTPWNDKVFHLYSSAKLGWGKASLRQDKDNYLSDRVFVATPEIGFEVNVTQFLKVGFSGGYRFVSGVEKLPGLDTEDFNSPVGSITFRFGGFGDEKDWNW